MKLFVLSWSPCSHRPCSPLTHSAPRYRMSLSVSYTRQIPTPQALPSLLSPLTRQTQPIQTHIWDTIYNLRVYGLCFLQFYCHRETFSSASTSAIKTTCLHTQLLGLPFFNTRTHTHARTHPTISSWKLINALVFFSLLLSKACFLLSELNIFHNYLGFSEERKKKTNQ